jgi:murein L,D-transpeptidase YcbB/YkuD
MQKTRKIERVTGSRDDGFIGGLEYNWLNMQKNTKRSKKSQALRMTALSGGLSATGSICREHEKIDKVTGSQDDGFVGGLEYNWLNMQKNTKRSKESQAFWMTICRSLTKTP